MENNQNTFRPTRRLFLKGSAALGTGLLIGLQLECGGGPAKKLGTPTPAPEPLAPNAFVRIAPDNTVTIISKHIEFGQGAYTGLATILAEELDADWKQVRVESAPSDPVRYGNTLWGPIQGTGGSTAMANSWMQLRQAGATARAVLVAAAAQTWSVPAAEITVERGQVEHAASRRTASFGELVATAATVAVPETVTLKDPKDFKLIGTQVPRVDVRAKSNGQAQFTMDVYLPDMLTALVARSPRFGGKVKSFDPTAARSVPGVAEVVQIPTGVAVLARSFWAAKKGRDALHIEWDDSAAETRSSKDIWADFRSLARKPGAVAARKGDAAAGIARAAKVIEAEYEFPFLAHAPMEPLDFVLHQQGERAEVWAGSQVQTTDHMTVAGVLGLEPDNVQIHTLLAGGSFGRRAMAGGDLAAEAAHIVKATGGKVPVKLVWTREDDIQGGFYRPMFLHKVRAGIDSKGAITGWEHRIVGVSIATGTPFEAMRVKDGVDHTSVEGAAPPVYAIDNISVDAHNAKVGVPVQWWRSVGHTHTGYVVEAFIDELAMAMKRDPLELRRSLLAAHPRHLGVLNLAAEKAGWGSPLPAGKARGIAVVESFSSYVAQVAEISLGPDGMPKVERVVCAVDCGIAINPDNIRAQIEGGLGFGLGAALHNEITLDKGLVVQSNFHDYLPLRMSEMPAVDVHIVPSAEAPTGIGEPGVPPIAPAVANAYLKLTGKPLRRLPISRSKAKE